MMMMMKALLRAGRGNGRWQKAATSERLYLSKMLNKIHVFLSRLQTRIENYKKWAIIPRKRCGLSNGYYLITMLPPWLLRHWCKDILLKFGFWSLGIGFPNVWESIHRACSSYRRGRHTEADTLFGAAHSFVATCSGLLSLYKLDSVHLYQYRLHLWS